MKQKISFLVLLSFFICFSVFAEVVLNIVLANPSEFNPETIPVRYELPLKIQQKDIIDPGGLEINYDETHDKYYLRGEFTLGPKETRNFRIRLRDIWVIPRERVESLKRVLTSRVESIRDPERREIANLIGDDLGNKLDTILTQQQAVADNIVERMKFYSVNVEKLRQIEEKIYSLTSLAGIYQGGQDEDLGTVTLFIEVENLWDNSEVLPVTYYLPAEIIPEYVVEQNDFEIRYDPNKGLFFLYREASFAPNEIKRYSVELRNVWQIKNSLLNQYLTEAQEYKELLLGSEVSDIAQELFQAVENAAEAITQSQLEAETVKERIAAYKINQNRLAEIRDNVERLRVLLIEFPQEELSVAQEAAQQLMERLETLTQIELSDFAQRLTEALRRIGVWRVVYTIILFIIGVTLFFYGLWFFRLRKEDKRQLKEKKPEAEPESQE